MIKQRTPTYSTLSLIIVSSLVASLKADIAVIPTPRTVQSQTGHFLLNDETIIRVRSEKAPDAAKILAELLRRPTGFPLPITKDAATQSTNTFVFALDDDLSQLGDEGYEIKCTASSVSITARKPAGLFYAIQTIRQLLPIEIEFSRPAQNIEWIIPCLEIEDSPRFPWRGLLLDPARHFLPKEWLLKYIDVMALHKLNRLHLHLTDDQGWRIEIKTYPRLTSVGAWRGASRYGGFYTQEDIREIVAYAAKCQIIVIPEIEMPAHALAALAAYPEHSCTGGPFKVATSWGPKKDIFCPGKESTFVFLEAILTEVISLFPSPYIHIGGDEARKARWEQHDLCQHRIKAQGLANEDELQSYFIRRIERFLNSRGKNLIGWQEILKSGLAPNATVQTWLSQESGIIAAKAGHDVIQSPITHCYFDYYQGPRNTEPQAGGGYTIKLDTIYGFEPVPSVLTSKQAQHILGLQGCVWGEYIATGSHAEYMTYPRGCALAEVGWSMADQKDYDNFLKRLTSMNARMEILNVNYRRDPAVVLQQTADVYQTFPAKALSISAQNGVLANDKTSTNAEIAMPPGHGICMLKSDGSFTYRPEPGFSGTDTFYYRTAMSFPVQVRIDVLNAGHGPLGIGGCILWLAADDIDADGENEGTKEAGVTPGKRVSVWRGKSGLNHHASSPESKNHAAIVPNAISERPVLRFDGTNAYYEFAELADIRTAFWVIKEDTGARSNSRHLLGHSSDYMFHRGDNKEIWSSDWSAPVVSSGTTRVNGTIVDGNFTPVPTTLAVISLRTAGNAKANQLVKDREYENRSWHGDIAEFVLFNAALSDEAIARIEDHLRSKWIAVSRE